MHVTHLAHSFGVLDRLLHCLQFRSFRRVAVCIVEFGELREISESLGQEDSQVEDKGFVDLSNQ